MSQEYCILNLLNIKDPNIFILNNSIKNKGETKWIFILSLYLM